MRMSELDWGIGLGYVARIPGLTFKYNAADDDSMDSEYQLWRDEKYTGYSIQLCFGCEGLINKAILNEKGELIGVSWPFGDETYAFNEQGQRECAARLRELHQRGEV